MTATTPGIARVRDLAEHAKGLPEGLIITFTVHAHGSLQSAHYAARSFQQAFSSLRAKARAKAERLNTRELRTPYADELGPYGMLACVKEPLPNEEGFRIRLCPGTSLSFANDVVDAKTGEPLREYSPQHNRAMGIVNLWLREAALANKHKAVFVSPLSAEDVEFMKTYDPETLSEFYTHMGLPDPFQKAETSIAQQAVGDIVDMADEDDVFGGKSA